MDYLSVNYINYTWFVYYDHFNILIRIYLRLENYYYRFSSILLCKLINNSLATWTLNLLLSKVYFTN